MDLQSGSKQKAIGELLSQLLSRDAVVFNSAINSNFASNVAYSGHGLKFRGASNLKHFAWFFNEIFTGGAATFDLDDIEWNEETNSATIQTVRYLRPRLFPLYGFAVPVETHLRFHADGGSAGQSASQSKVYVTELKEHWIADRMLEPFPFIAWLFTASVTPFATLLVLALSNILFAGNARLTSSKRQYIDTSVDALSVRAKKALPKQVANNAGSGYQRGEKLAQGCGTLIANVANRTSYPILSTLEVLSQRGAEAVPLSLPYPYIYDAHSHTPSKVVKKSGKKAPSKSSSTTPFTVPESAAPLSQNAKTDEKMATVDVAPSLNGQDQGKSVQISSRVNTESADKPAPASSKADKSLYAQLKKDGDLPGQQSEKLSLPAHHSTQTGASSEEEEQASSHNDKAADGSHKKKKSSSKKKKGGISHVHPPSFKEALHEAEEHDAHVRH